MSDEPQESRSGWHTDTLHAHLAAQIQGLRDLQTQRIDDFKEMVRQAEQFRLEAKSRAEAIDAYNRSQANEWGNSLRDLRSTFATLAVVQKMQDDLYQIQLAQKDFPSRADLGNLASDVKTLRDVNSSNSGRAATIASLASGGLSILAMVVVIVIAFVGHTAPAPVAPQILLAPIAPVAPVLPLAPAPQK